MNGIENLKSTLFKNHVVISNIDEIDDLVLNISNKKYKNIIFEKTTLKNYCFDKLSKLLNISIINSNSCLNRFCMDLHESDSSDIIIFDNINKCNNSDILDIIINKKSILVY